MIRVLTYAMVYLGSALMIYNIYGFVRFARYIRGMKTWNQGDRVLYVPIALLVSFLIGYLVVGIFGKPDIVMAGILFGGSVFVYVMYRLLSSIIQRVIENEHLEAELLAAEENSRAKSSFLSSISHEMRTPVNIILGMNALTLTRPDLPEAARDHLEKANHSARYLSELINNLLTIQQAESGGLAIQAKPFSLKDLVEQISAQVSAACEQKGLECQTSLAKCVARDFIGDAAELKRAIMCIVDNAVKYTDAPGTVRFCVKCAKDQSGTTRVRFIVSDTGIGIDEGFLPRIFEPLTQEDGSATNRFGGSGMGLTVAGSIIAQMNGGIDVESRKGVGSTFTITVPIAPVPNEVCASCGGCMADQDCEHCAICKLGRGVAQAQAQETETAAPIRLAGRRVLVAEDTDENAEIIADLLDLEDIQTERAENGLAAVQRLEASPEFYFDAILMDLRMPVMDGWEAARRIRALDRPDARGIPIIALSANDQDQDIRQSLAVGMNAHLSKPIDADLLYKTLSETMQSVDFAGRGG